MQGGPSDSSATSNQPPASSNASSGSSNASSGGSGGSSSSSNESSGDVNIPSAADDSSSLDPLSVGLTASLENSAASTKLLVDSVKARALQFARRLTKRADFTCMYRCFPEIFDEHLADPVGWARYRGRDLLHGQQWPLLRQREVRPCLPICRVSAQPSQPQIIDADPADGTAEMGISMSPTAPLVISTPGITPSPTGAKAIFTTGHAPSRAMARLQRPPCRDQPAARP